MPPAIVWKQFLPPQGAPDVKFTILTQYFAPEVGAPQVRLMAFCRALLQNGHDVHVVTAMPNYPAGVIFEKYKGKLTLNEAIDDVPIFRTWIYAATGRNIVRRLANYFSFAFTSLVALARVSKADVLFVETPPLFLCISAWVLCKIRNQKLCINISDLWPDSVVTLGLMSEDSLFIRASYKLESWLYQQSWRVSAVTEGILRQLKTVKSVDSAKLRFLPNGVDLDMFHPGDVDVNWQTSIGLEGKKIFAYTGTHGYAQGLDVILNAANALCERSNIAFLFVGEGPDKARLKAKAVEMQLRNVTFLDAQPTSAMSKIFNSVTACIAPLLDRPLFLDARPSKLFPPMGCARPVIFSGAGEAATLIQSAQCGLVTKPEDGLALAKAVEWLADNDEECEAMGRRGRELVEREYSWSAIVEKWLLEL